MLCIRSGLLPGDAGNAGDLLGDRAVSTTGLSAGRAGFFVGSSSSESSSNLARRALTLLRGVSSIGDLEPRDEGVDAAELRLDRAGVDGKDMLACS